MALIKRLIPVTCLALLGLSVMHLEMAAQTFSPLLLPAGKATMEQGFPAIKLPHGAVIIGVHLRHHENKFALCSYVASGVMFIHGIGSVCVSAGRVIWYPAKSKHGARGFDVPRSEVTDVQKRVHLGEAFLHIRVGTKHFDFSGEYADGADTRSVLQWTQAALLSFPTALARFDELTRDLPVPLSQALRTEVALNEGKGDAAVQAGKLYDALHNYEVALQALPTQWAPRDVENRLEEKTIKLVQRMNPKPAIPQDAMRHMAYAETAFQEAKGPADFDNAIQEMNKALRLAPWWGAAYKNLGLLDEKASRDADAARNLQLYLSAEPNAPDAKSLQMKIYSLQYKAKQQAASN